MMGSHAEVWGGDDRSERNRTRKVGHRPLKPEAERNVVGIEELFEKEKAAHPQARFLDGALLRDRDTDRTYPVVLSAIHYEDAGFIEIRLTTPNSSFVMETLS